MLLKLIIIGAVGFWIYKKFGGTLTWQKDTKGVQAKKQEDEDLMLDKDTLVECEKCSTFVVKSEAIIYNGKYYCSKECLPN